MAWRLRKIFSTGPFRFSLSRRGVGWSWGVPGLRHGVSADGRRYVSVGFPSLGLYWIKYLGASARNANRASPLESESQVISTDPMESKKRHRLRR